MRVVHSLRAVAVVSALCGCSSRPPDCEEVCTNVARVMTQDCKSDCEELRKNVKGACVRLDCPKWSKREAECMAKAADLQGMESCVRSQP